MAVENILVKLANSPKRSHNKYQKAISIQSVAIPPETSISDDQALNFSTWISEFKEQHDCFFKVVDK